MTGNYPQVLLKHRKPDRISTLAEYREVGGYAALRRVLTQMIHKTAEKVHEKSTIRERAPFDSLG